MKTIEIPELALVAFVGPSGSGKSTLARRHFLRTEVLSSDFFRGLISDDESNQAVSAEAFDALHYILGKRLAAMHSPWRLLPARAPPVRGVEHLGPGRQPGHDVDDGDQEHPSGQGLAIGCTSDQRQSWRNGRTCAR